MWDVVQKLPFSISDNIFLRKTILRSPPFVPKGMDINYTTFYIKKSLIIASDGDADQPGRCDGDFLFNLAMRVTAMAICQKSSDAMSMRLKSLI